MARNENPPFGRGATFFDQDQTISAADVTATNYLLGKEWVFEDEDLTDQSTHVLRTANDVKVRVVRNISGGALLPKSLVTPAATSTSGYTNYFNEVDGMVRTTAGKCYPVDEWLPAAGVRDDDIFYVVIQGPATLLTSLAGDATNVIAVGDNLVALTAATSGATTAGRATPADFTGATALLANQIVNRIGRAMSAKTTAQTNGDVLAYISEF